MMKKTLLYTLMLLFVLGTMHAQCPQVITFSTQNQIDSFAINYPNCTALPGKVFIEGEPGNFTITNLNGLSQIVSINGDLRIDNNDSLVSLSGLEGLQTIGGGLILDDNLNLENISAFESLTSVGLGQFGVSLLVTDNEKLTSLNALENISFTYSSIHILNNNALINLNGFSSIDSMNVIKISENATLESLTGLENLTFANFLEISENNNLTNLSGLESLSSTNGLNVFDNSSLLSLTGLEALLNVGGTCYIRNNPLIVDLSGMESLISTLDLIIYGNTSLANLSGLESLESIQTLNLSYNESLTTIQHLSNVNTISGYLFIRGNDLLPNLSGLEGFTEFEYIHLQLNQSLTDLSALSDLTSTGYITIRDNDALENLSGLENLSSITAIDGAHIQITENDALVDLSALNPIGNLSSLTILNNSALPTVSGFSQIDTIFQYCRINDNSLLTDITGLNQVKNIGKGAPASLFDIDDNISLTSISGFNSLETVHASFTLQNNPLLTSIDGFASIDSLLGGLDVASCTALEDFSAFNSLAHLSGDVSIFDNSSLNVCEFPALCNYILDGSVPEISNNAGCPTLSDLLLDCLEENTIFIGSIISDLNANCMVDNSESGIDNWLVNASNNDYSFTISTDSVGNYWIPLLEGEWSINFITPSSFWTSCFEDSLVVSTGLGDTVVLDGLVSPLADCPYIDWGTSMSTLRICTPSTFVINYCNYGSQIAFDHAFSVTLDSSLTFQSSPYPHTIDSEGIIHFELDSMELFECDQISFSALVNCDSIELGNVLCIGVELSPDDLCASSSAWDGSTVTANGYCANDSIFFELENIGTGNMAQPGQFKVEIVIDDIVMMQDVDDYQLQSGAVQMLKYEIAGMGMRLATEQSPDHPVGGTVSMVVPNCNSDSNNVVLTLLPNTENGNPFYERLCGEVVGPFDPNIKSAIPAGVGPMNAIDKDWTLNYTVQFQNTGNDTAFLVVLKDTLSENLDLSTIKMHGGSHDFSWNLNPGRELVFTFENILLVDSFTNEAASHGFVQFEITPKSSLIPGDHIENRVGIYFDFNDPIITNTVFHSIRKPIVVSSEHTDWCAGEDYDGLAILQDTAFLELTEYIEYDSIHFLHLDVNPTSESFVMAEVLIGEYLNDILINGDTTFITTLINHFGCDSLVTYTVAALTSTQGPNPLEQTRVFPNPVNDQLHILNHQNGEAQHWTMANNVGQVIWEKTLLAEAQLSAMDMNRFPAGVYWLKVKTGGASLVWQIVTY